MLNKAKEVDEIAEVCEWREYEDKSKLRHIFFLGADESKK